MKIKFFCPRWGAEHIAWKDFLPAVKDAGYTGIEWFPYGETGSYNSAEVVSLLHENNLEFAIVMAVVERTDTVSEYLTELGRQLTELASIGSADNRPLHISVQAGREFYSDEQIAACLEVSSKVSSATGIPIYQETHRNKWSYAAHAVYPQLLKHPDLSLTLDLSHWFCVSESYLEDQQPAVELAIRHTKHVHARVGHTEGPQVWEPAAPEYEAALQQHLAVWDKWIAQMNEKAPFCTITPEFGPPPYMVFAGRAGTPFDEQWRVNLWMKNFLEKRYASI